MTGSVTKDRFSTKSASTRKEIDLRQEMDNTLYGSPQEIAKGMKVLVRRIRTDSKGRKVKCVCNFKEEGRETPKCTSCLGEGYYWDETMEDAFKMEVGSESAKARRVFFESGGEALGKLTRFFFRYDVDIIEIDSIIELEYDAEGDPVQPYTRGRHWKIQELEDKRSDTGRREYLIAYCSKSDHIYTDARRR